MLASYRKVSVMRRGSARCAIGTGLWVVVALFAAEARSDGEAFKTERMAGVDQAIRTAMEQGEMPGAVLSLGHRGQTVYAKAYGRRAVKPNRQAMTRDTIFDLASLTKPVATATSIMILADRGEIDLTAPVARYMPAFGQNGKSEITIAQCLLHRTGLIPDNPVEAYHHGYETAIERICALEPTWEPGTRFEYSDVGYIVLGHLVQVIDGRPLDVFAKQEIFKPLEMTDTTFNPPSAWRERIAPTEKRDGRWLRGEVHDPRANPIGGVAGHAGLFSTASDLARYCRMLLNGGKLAGQRILSTEAVDRMTRTRWFEHGEIGRAYGFDVDSPFSSPRGQAFPIGRSFGHTGFTGPSFWIDPVHEVYLILMTSRLHPDGKGSVVQLRREVANATGAELFGQNKLGGVRTGIDVLKERDFASLQGQAVGLITNHTGRDRQGRRTLDILRGAESVQLTKVFAPEHGLFGELEGRVSHHSDDRTGLKVYSLYGKTRRPTAAMLKGLDTLVFDVQDIGTRFYTYISTMGYAMEAAAKHDVRMMVLDRPNPLGGQRVNGPRADPGRLGFTAYRPIPIVHGMTIGELAHYFNDQFEIGCDLKVVTMRGWSRSTTWEQTNLTWRNPSPNMRNLTQALLYPGIGLLERSNLSVGRGTDQPFELFGAPWIEHRRLANRLNKASIPGLRFVPIVFTPNASKFEGERCQGVYILITDRDAVQPVATGYIIAWHLRQLFGRDFEVSELIELGANTKAQQVLLRTGDPQSIPECWQQSVSRFKQTRQPYLLYE
jgi:uncharacterized protein YbbC (DUF1343 family)/CubicO group peptidase (beta-lactamase class C family)